jgi:cold shock CspA family protein
MKPDLITNQNVMITDYSREERIRFIRNISREIPRDRKFIEPPKDTDKTYLTVTLASRSTRFQFALNSWGLWLSALATGIAIVEVPRFEQMEHFDIVRALFCVLALGLVTAMVYRTTRLLWSRPTFTCGLTWTEVEGTSQQSELSSGNQFSGSLRSKSTLTCIEDVSLWVWSADITSVALDPHGKNFTVTTSATDGFTKFIAEHLIHFAGEQRSVAVPTSRKDDIKAGILLDKDMQTGKHNDVHGFWPVKQTGTMPVADRATGTIKFYDPGKQFGAVTARNGVDYFFSSKQSDDVQFQTGVPVDFLLIATQRGIQAIDLQTHQ